MGSALGDRRFLTRTALVAASALLLAAAIACGPAGNNDGGSGGPDGGRNGFDDHMHGPFSEVRALREFMATGPSRAQTKFLITYFNDDSRRMVEFEEDSFYSMHDECYWYRLLNGVAVPGVVDVRAVTGLHFDTIAAIISWARTRTSLPLDLTWVDGGTRLYSPNFYALAGFSATPPPRLFGLGSVVNVPARTAPTPQPELWLFELEYRETPTHADIVRYFDALQAALPAELASQLKWVTRSPAHVTLAQQMRDQQLQYWDRVVGYDVLVTPGAVEVYNPGVAAGPVLVVRPGDGSIEDSTPSTILVLAEVPDFLPPCAALITAVPQTPLAHINILARNRGIPNVYLAGALEDPRIDQIARAYAKGIVYAQTPDQLMVQAMSDTEYATYRSLVETGPVIAPAVDLTATPLHVDLELQPLSQMSVLRPAIGGKSAGFIALAGELPEPDALVALPLAPTAITIKGYAEHILPFRARIEAMLAAADFVDSAQVRLLVLEGATFYDQRYPDANARTFREQFVTRHPAGDVLGDLVRGGGLRRMLEQQTIAPATLAAVEQHLSERFADLAPGQALRFRSSSNVEDMEGFNGAGLYESFTGYLHPDQAPAGNRDRTVAVAVAATWASYWADEAFEERRLSQVDHLSGAMGVLIHPRFDNDDELANGVFTVTLHRTAEDQSVVMEINTQLGSMSVTNPPVGSGALPEVCRLTQPSTKSSVLIERLQPSTEVAAGAAVLHDQFLLNLFARARQIAMVWLDDYNRSYDRARASNTTTLDYEFKLMAAGWPALASGQQWPARIVFKQVRSLEPGLARIPVALRNQPVPRDVLGRSRRIDRRVCVTSNFYLLTLDVYTDPNRAPDLGYGVKPFEAYVSFSFVTDLPTLGIATGYRTLVLHTGFAAVDHPAMTAGNWDLAVEFSPGAAASAGFDGVAVTTAGDWTLTHGAQQVSGSGTNCSVTILHASPEDYLLGLIEAGN